jgi:hypothetical protein
MRNKLLVLLAVIIFSGCDTADERPDCSLVSCLFVAHSLKIKYVDKETGNPLIVPGSAYSLSDFKIAKTVNSTYIPELKDDADPGIIVLTPLLGGQTLTLGNLPTDKITMQTKSRGTECCAGYDIISIKINDETVCAPCGDLGSTVAVIEK